MKNDISIVKEHHSERLPRKAKEISKEIAVRLRDPKSVFEAVHSKGNVITDSELFPWGDISLSHGYPGNIHLLSLWREMDDTFDWQEAIHSNLLEIQSYLAKYGTRDISLFSGWTGIASSVLAASNHGEFYNQFLNQIHQWMAPLIEERLQTSTELMKQKNGVPVEMFDTISGAAGLGRYLLKNPSDPNLSPLIEPTINFLIDLTKPIRLDGKTVPGWFTPSKLHLMERDRQRFPTGSLNCGMAHGIPGPLALLSTAYNSGIELPGQYGAIECIAEWLLDVQGEDEYGTYWPHMIPFEYYKNDSKHNLQRQREAWCYGTPGVACALYTASKSLNNIELKQHALRSFIQSVKYECEQNNINSPSICHGLSGLLLMCWRMWNNSKEPALEPLIHQLSAELLQRFDPSHPLGFTDAEPAADDTIRWLTKAGLLEGAAGIGATLFGIAEQQTNDWDYLLMLS
ncbi:lanthionine synthetase C family protein [Paenibacillus sp. VCA1]|uniref:lanthionine synthetase C family protein n=1 Tax=Paenibacillus sp. VCA1 TaxID=3039148 RepID=UPI002871B830|nr:lanthionine synthetase C family protein [Paenibacillus sp. VCA1]MDR9857745.1 lanthionine synthetase C family protein [Paenibacillus sp. VCA1]